VSGPKQLQNLIATSRNLNSSNVPLEVAILDASGAQVTSFGAGGTQYTEGDQDATITGTALMLEKPSSNQIEAAQGSTAAPTSDAFGLTVRQVGYVAPSTGPIAISSIAGRTLVDQNSTVWQTQAALRTSSGGNLDGSTTAPAAGALGLHVRQVMPSPQSTSILVNMQTAGGSTTLVSSQAGLKHKVFAYAVTSTVVGVSSCAFISSLTATAERWGLLLGTGSSGISGANLAIGPPGSLFETDASVPLGFTASSTGLYKVSFSWFSEA